MNISYWSVFRVTFSIFFLYLIGDAFNRWNGFRYYATFSEFLPGVALISVLWCITAALTALIIWVLLKTSEWVCRSTGRQTKSEQGLLFFCTVMLLGSAICAVNMYIVHIGTTLQEKLLVFFCVIAAAILFVWLFRGKAEDWMKVIQERITPLIWLFGIMTVLSVPVVAYSTWGGRNVNSVSQRVMGSSAEHENRRDIILVTFDALTARDMSVYGYQRPTTPFITEWAREASLFMRLHAGGSLTKPTTASLMTGKRMWTHQTYFNKVPIKPYKIRTENLALALKNDGYYTMAFIVNPVATVNSMGLPGSFDVAPPPTEFFIPLHLYGSINKLLYELFGDKFPLYDWIMAEDFIFHGFVNIISKDLSETQVVPEKAFSRFFMAMDNRQSGPYFAWIHLLPPHDPFLPPEPYMGMYGDDGQLNTLNKQEEMEGYSKAYKSEDQPTVNILRKRYDEFIRYCDKQFEDFITELTKRSELKNTVVILSADHGESFEHNYIKHGGRHLYEQMTHIPLIIKGPNQTEGRIINELADQTDVPATILDFANIKIPSWMEGHSLLPLTHGKKIESYPVFSMALYENPRRHKVAKGTIAVWEGDYKLIRYLQEEKSLLFNLKKDPDELNDLSEKEPEVSRRLLSIIQENLKRANEIIRRGE